MRSLSRWVGDLRACVSYSVAPPHFIVILGMHRSGTSCVSRTLSLMGASIGLKEEPALVAPDGEIHWEPSSLIWVNDEILARSDGSWNSPPDRVSPTKWDLLRCRRFLWDYHGSGIAVFKDPRLCLTYGAWRQVLPDHSVVVSIRHPMNVARSLERRDGLELSRGLALWTNYNRRILEDVDAGPHTYWFDFDGGRSSLEKLARELQQDLGLEASEKAIEHYDPSAHRFHGTTSLPEETQIIYDQLIARATR